MALREVINGPAGVSLAIGLARVMPPRQGRWLATRLGKRLAQIRKTAQVQAVEANQSVVGQGNLSEKELRHITQATFQSTARCIYDYYHNFDRPESIKELVEIDETLKRRIEENRKKREGILLAGLHFSNFDLALRAAALAGLRAQVLAYPQPQYGYRIQNRLRELEGMEITPTSFTAMQKALTRLKSGGIVATGIDRPVPASRFRPKFFGRPSALPVSHVQLALRAGVPVVVASVKTKPDGHYCYVASEPIPMRRVKDPDEEVLWNAERILQVIECIILSDPKQWGMFYPVWPDAASRK